MTQSLVNNLQERLEPAVADLGYDLLCIELQGTGNDAVLRLYIDSPNGIGVDDCVAVSREVSALLDVDDPIDSAYRLEVSSPGMDRPLVKPQHFNEYIGRDAKLKLRVPHAGRRNFRGKLLACSEEAVSVEVDGERFDLPFIDIERARLVPVFD